MRSSEAQFQLFDFLGNHHIANTIALYTRLTAGRFQALTLGLNSLDRQSASAEDPGQIGLIKGYSHGHSIAQDLQHP